MANPKRVDQLLLGCMGIALLAIGVGIGYLIGSHIPTNELYAIGGSSLLSLLAGGIIIKILLSNRLSDIQKQALVTFVALALLFAPMMIIGQCNLVEFHRQLNVNLATSAFVIGFASVLVYEWRKKFLKIFELREAERTQALDRVLN